LQQSAHGELGVSRAHGPASPAVSSAEYGCHPDLAAQQRAASESMGLRSQCVTQPDQIVPVWVRFRQSSRPGDSQLAGPHHHASKGDSPAASLTDSLSVQPSQSVQSSQRRSLECVRRAHRPTNVMPQPVGHTSLPHPAVNECVSRGRMVMPQSVGHTTIAAPRVSECASHVCV